MGRTLVEPERTIPVVDHAELLVVGGGVAGLAAAITGRKHGLDVILVERYGFAGGICTAGLLGTFCGFHTVNADGTLLQTVQGFGDEVLDELRAVGGVDEPKVLYGKTAIIPYDITSLRLVTDELLQRYGVRLYLHSLATAVQHNEGRVEGIFLETKAGRVAITADVVIDATGDGDVAAQAGAQFEVGVDGLTQYPTTLFMLGNVDAKRAASVSRERLAELLAEAAATGDYTLPRLDGGIVVLPVTGEARCNLTRVGIGERPVNGLDPRELSEGEIEGRLQAKEYLRFVREYIPGFENAYIREFPTMMGIRETRRIKGLYQLNEDDVLSARKFDDAIGCNSWPIELHGSGNDTRWDWLPPGEFYQIPYRCLVVEGFTNLMAIGRCLSSTHGAHASARVTASCINQGEAAATAAALSLQEKQPLGDVETSRLQSHLRELGVFLG